MIDRIGRRTLYRARSIMRRLLAGLGEKNVSFVAARRIPPAVGVALILGMIGIHGCSGGSSGRPKVIPVTGSVKVKGVAVPNITVTFFAVGSAPRNPTGTTDAAGNFKLTSYDTDDGAVPGDYVVTLAATQTTAAKKPEEMTAQDMIDMSKAGKTTSEEGSIPLKYADTKTSELKRSVVDGDSNVFNFDIKD